MKYTILIALLVLVSCSGGFPASHIKMTEPVNEYLINKRQPKLQNVPEETYNTTVEKENRHLNLQNYIYWQPGYYTGNLSI